MNIEKQTEPGFNGALIVLVALFILWLIATTYWDRLGPAWRSLWEVKPAVTEDSGSSFFRWFQEHLIPKQSSLTTPPVPYAAWTPGLESVNMDRWA